MSLSLSAKTHVNLQWQPLPPLPDAHGFAAPFVGTLNGQWLLAGGSNFPGNPLWEGGLKNWSDTIWLYIEADTQWQKVGQLPEGMAHGIAFSDEDSIILVGGQNGQQVFDTVWRLRIDAGGVQLNADLPALPEPLGMMAGARVGQTLYVAGGISEAKSPQTSHAFYALDLSAKEPTWNRLPPWPGPARCLAAAGAVDGDFVLIGGISRLTNLEADAYLRDAYRYNPESGWTRLPDLPHAAAAAATPLPVSVNGDLFVIGGVDGKQLGLDPRTYPKVPRRIQSFSKASQSWHILAEAPIARVGVHTASRDGLWLLPTGESSAGTRSPEVWSLQIAAD